ncbi:hypothetical protein NDU88_005078 [Pleurodeles waltl]|uniref:Uncharacterized protein n=1 Tax=Pleurodeles waltl TaxID=8319 RepID=A0AAV7UGZ7_PLEWA|nr:hypothetical protein NDU88_005078 [Pleurodeles waltl]
MESRGISNATPKTSAQVTGNLRCGNCGPHLRRVQTDPSKEQVSRERAQVVAEVEHHVKSPSLPLSVQVRMKDDNLGANGDLADMLLGSSPLVTLQTAEKLI